MGLRFAGHEGGRVAEALSLPLVIAVRPLGFCGSVIGRFAAVWGNRPSPMDPRWFVGLPRRRGSFPECDRRALALLCRGPVSERFWGRACLFMLGGVRSSIARLSLSFLVEADSNRRKLQRSARVGRGRKGALMAPAWADPAENASAICSFQSRFAPRSGRGM